MALRTFIAGLGGPACMVDEVPLCLTV